MLNRFWCFGLGWACALRCFSSALFGNAFRKVRIGATLLLDCCWAAWVLLRMKVLKVPAERVLRCCKIAAGMLLDRPLLCGCQAAAEVLKIAGCHNGQPANCCSAATGMLLDCYRELLERALGRLLPTCQTARVLLDRLPHRRIVASANWQVPWWYWCGSAFRMQKLIKATARFWPCILRCLW